MKFGIIDQNYMNTLATRSDEFAKMQPALQAIIGSNGGRKGLPFVAYISSAVAKGTGGGFDIMWRYTWHAVTFEELGRSFENTYVETTEEFSEDVNSYDIRAQLKDIPNDEQAFAYNMAELSNLNTFPIVFGIDVSADSYPDGFIPVGIPIGSFVLLRKIIDYRGGIHYIFDRQGTHDGTCEEEG